MVHHCKNTDCILCANSNVNLEHTALSLSLVKSLTTSSKMFATGEIKFIPPVVFPLIRKMVHNGLVPISPVCAQIIQYAPGVIHLIQLDSSLNPAAAQNGKLSDDLLNLLTITLGLAEATLLPKAPVVNADVGRPHQITSKPYCPSNPNATPFEVMIRTGSWFPRNPVIRTVPSFMADHLAQMARKSKSNSKASMNRRASMDKDMEEQLQRIQMEGTLCIKYKTSFRALTPGIFAVFCAGCGVCVGFEMMSHAESTLVPFRIFCHRMWTKEDADVWKKYQETGAWEDWMYIVKSVDSDENGDAIILE